MGKLEYLIILVPVFLAIVIIFYFIYHLWHTEKYSRNILKLISKKIEELEASEIESGIKIKKMIEEFKKASMQKRIHLFDLERQIGIDMASFNNKLDKALKKDFNQKEIKKKNSVEVLLMDEKSIKKEVYRHLALSVFGNLIGYGNDNKIIMKNMYFVNEPSGDLYLFSRKSPEIDELNMNQPVYFSVFKEEELAMEFAHIRIEGQLALIEKDSSEWNDGLALFTDKSPFIGNIPWVDNPDNYSMFYLKNTKIYFQKTKEERLGQQPIYLIRESEAI